MRRALAILVVVFACSDPDDSEAPLCLADAFDGTAIDFNQWRPLEAGSRVMLAVAEGRLEIKLAPNSTASNGLVSRRTHDLTGGTVEVELVTISGPRGPKAQAGFDAIGDDVSFTFSLEQGQLTARVVDRGTASDVTVVLDGNHRFLRLRHDATTDVVHFEGSGGVPFGGTEKEWTAIRADPAPASVAGLAIDVRGTTYDFGNPGPGTVLFDNLRVTNAACP